jgi:hypothetical protein
VRTYAPLDYKKILKGWSIGSSENNILAYTFHKEQDKNGVKLPIIPGQELQVYPTVIFSPSIIYLTNLLRQ